MKISDFNKIHQEAETLRPEFDYKYSEVYGNHIGDAGLTEAQKDDLRYELELFRLMLINKYEQPDKKRFAPMIIYTNGVEFPDVKQFTEKQLHYYKKRSDETKNLEMKSRYLDIVYELLPKERTYELATKLVDTYLDLSDWDEHSVGPNKIDQLARAFTVAKQWRQVDASLLDKSAVKIVEKLEEYVENDPRWSLDLLEIIIEEHKFFPLDKKDKIVELASKGLETYGVSSNLSIKESYIKAEGGIRRVFSKEYSMQEEAKALADSYVKEAKSRTDSMMVQQHFYREAMRVYQKAGMKSGVDEMLARIEEIGRSDEYNSQFMEFSVDVPIDPKMFDDIRETLRKNKDKAKFMAFSGTVNPSWSSAIESAKESPTPIHVIFSSEFIDENGIPHKDNADELTRHARNYYDADVSMKSLILDQVFGKMIAENEITKDDFLPHFAKIKHINEQTFASIDKALDLYFNAEYYASLNILVTQFENLLLELSAKVFDNPKYSTRDGYGMTKKMLSTIIDEIEPIVGLDFAYDLRHWFTELRGPQLRNKVAHGTLKTDGPNRHYGLIVIQQYMRILVPLEYSGETETNGAKVVGQ